MTIAFTIVAAINLIMLIALLIAAWLYVPRPWRHRYHCHGCGHPVTSHITTDGAIGTCHEGTIGIASIVSGGCPCRTYIGRQPRHWHRPTPTATKTLTTSQ